MYLQHPGDIMTEYSNRCPDLIYSIILNIYTLEYHHAYNHMNKNKKETMQYFIIEL